MHPHRRPAVHLLGCAAVIALVALPAAAQTPDLAAPLPTDTSVHMGRLPNGLRYMIRRNVKPEKRAELRLVVNAGSILEDTTQLGLAHFVEHMAFNGTTRFPKGDIVNFLERSGMRFGADLNAYTSFDETVYMLQIPTDSAHLMKTALDVLEDWAHGISFSASELQKERGVVVEEWRTGRSASTRVQNKQLPVMLRGSQYALRLPIGDKDLLQKFPDSLATAFYRDWYRPDLMTVIAVGDFDVKQMESSIRERFSRLTAPTTTRARTFADVPDHDETLVSIETDKEYPSASVVLMWLRPGDSTRTVGDVRRGLVAGFYDGMVSARFSELTQRPDAPFTFAGSGRGSLVRTKDVYQLYAGVKESGFEKAAEALLVEAERIARFGFTQTELDRRRTNYLRSLEQAYAERDKTNSSVFASEFVNSALTGDPIMSIDQDQALAKALLPTITLDEVNALARTSFTEKNRVIVVAAPEKPEIKMPTKEQMLAVFDRAKQVPITAFVDSTSAAPLIANEPTPGKIVAERTLPGTGILEWKLSNGARVLLKPTDFKADEVLFSGYSAGGTSLLADKDILDAQLAAVVAGVSGAGAFNQITLGKRLTGKRAAVSTSLGDYKETIRGQASSRDVETMFQLAWLRLTKPRADSVAVEAFKSRIRTQMLNARNSPESAFQDTIAVTMSRHHPRERIFTPEMLDSVSTRRAFDIYRERFSDAGSFTFALVGSFAPDSVRPLIERYIGSLPSSPRREKARDLGIRPPTGVVERTVRKGVEPKAQTVIAFTGKCAYSYENRVVLGALRDLLDIRLREALREDKGGTYGVGVGANCSSIPDTHYQITLSFGSAPERANELVQAAFAVIDSIKAGSISDSNLTKIKEIPIRSHETALKQNGSWLSAMLDADEDGRDQRDFLRLPSLVNGITRQKLRDAARLYLRRDQYARFTLLPEGPDKIVP